MTLRPAHWIAIDAAAALLLVPAATLLFRGVPGPHGPNWAPAVLLLTGIPAVAARRVWPRAALAVAVLTGPCALGAELFPASWLPAALVLYVIPVRFSGRTANWIFGLTVLVAIAGANAAGPRRLDVTLGGGLVLAVAWLSGYTVRQQRGQAEQRAQQALVEERLRIARELHDVIAHSMSLIAVQAGVACHVADERPEQVRLALGSIEQTSRDALHEMRALLEVLRSPGLEPAPTLGHLDTLVRRSAEAGLQVELSVTGEVDGLPAGIGLAAYRVVQEALTNTIKHAGVDRAVVAVTRTPAELTIAVSDHGRGPSGVAGHGIIGMQERIAMYGGDFQVGAAPGGGFSLTARIPLQAR